MGGVGKSEIATEYAYRQLADFEVVWFVPSEQPAQILRALIEFGELLEAAPGGAAGEGSPARVMPPTNIASGPGPVRTIPAGAP